MKREMIFRAIVYVLLLLSLNACTAEDRLAGIEKDGADVATVRLSVIFATPTGKDTRSATDTSGGSTDGEELATPSESHISSAWVILGALPKGASAPAVVHSAHDVKRFQELTENRWLGKIKAPPGRYRLLVVANPTPEISAVLQSSAGKPWNEMLLTAVKETSPVNLSQIWQDNRFLMTNAYQGSITANDVELVEGENESYVTIPVQRVCARFDYRAAKENNAYTVTATLNGSPVTATVTLTQAGLMNISRGYHLFKLLCADEAGVNPTVYAHESATNYVFDTDWIQKKNIREDNTAETSEIFFYSSEMKEPILYKQLPDNQTVDTPMFYASENTIPGVLRQVNCLSTAMVFSGLFSLNGVTADNLYYFENNHPQFYTTLEQLEQDNSISLPANPDDTQLAAAGVKRFTRNADGSYPVWYTYWNRHNDNNKHTQMGVMEFAVVRNNIYKLMVNSISFFGLPKDPTDENNPWKPEGVTPDEKGPQLDVNVTVAAWNDRTFDCEI